MFCSRCGQQVPEGDTFCASCGAPTAAPSPGQPPTPTPPQQPVAPVPGPLTPAPPGAAPGPPPGWVPAPTPQAPAYQPAPAPTYPAPAYGAPAPAPGYGAPAPAYGGPGGYPGGRVGFAFEGDGWACLGWGLLAMLLAYTLIGMAWGYEFFLRWLFSKVRLSDGTQVRFDGKGGQIWWLPLIMLAAYAVYGGVAAGPSLLVPLIARDNENLAAGLAIGGGVLAVLLLLPYLLVCMWVGLRLIQWMLEGLTLGCGTRLRFTGTIWQYLGWSLLLGLSLYTIVGWAWAMVALINWMFRNTVASGGQRLVFTGTGGEILWRTLVVGLVAGVTLGIGYPWMLVWMWKWLAEKTFVERGYA